MSISTTCVTLANGVKAPQVGIGMWLTKDGDEAQNAVSWALQAGYRHVDTAAGYQNEPSVGAAIRASGLPREQVFITTKLWNTDHGYDSALAAFEKSRERLGVEYIDLYLIHFPRGRAILEKEGKKYLDTWRAFEKLYADKKVRAIGVSNFQIHHLEDIFAMCTVRPMVNQFECHPQLTQKPLRDFCAQHNIAVMAYSPLGEGKLLENETIKAIGVKHGKTAAQIILRWDLQHGLITIPKSVHKERIEANAKVFDFTLTAEDMAAIDALNTDTRFGPNPDTADF